MNQKNIYWFVVVSGGLFCGIKGITRCISGNFDRSTSDFVSGVAVLVAGVLGLVALGGGGEVTVVFVGLAVELLLLQTKSRLILFPVLSMI